MLHAFLLAEICFKEIEEEMERMYFMYFELRSQSNITAYRFFCHFINVLSFYILQIVTAYKPKDSDKSLALDPISIEKNRNTDFIPLYPKRVKLPFLPGVEGSDYINATYLQVTLPRGLNRKIYFYT